MMLPQKDKATAFRGKSMYEGTGYAIVSFSEVLSDNPRVVKYILQNKEGANSLILLGEV